MNRTKNRELIQREYEKKTKNTQKRGEWKDRKQSNGEKTEERRKRKMAITRGVNEKIEKIAEKIYHRRE